MFDLLVDAVTEALQEAQFKEILLVNSHFWTSSFVSTKMVN